MFKKICFSLILFTGMSFAKDINIAVITHGADTDAFWSIVKNGVVNASKDSDVKVDYRNPASGDMTEMARLIKSAIAKRPDGLVVSIPDNDALGKVIKRAIDLKIPVITINAGSDYGKKIGTKMHVGQSEYDAGYKAGLEAKKNGVKSFVCVNHEITNISLERRCKGFADALGVKNNMLDVNTDPSEIERKVKPKLKNIDAVLTLGPTGAAPTIAAIESLRLKKHVYFVTFDLSKDITKAIKKGVIDFAIDQQQYLQGYLPIIFLSQYVKYGTLPSGDVNSGPGFVNKANVAEVEKLAGKYR